MHENGTSTRLSACMSSALSMYTLLHSTLDEAHTIAYEVTTQYVYV